VFISVIASDFSAQDRAPPDYGRQSHSYLRFRGQTKQRLILRNSSQGKMPDLVHWLLKEVYKLTRHNELPVELSAKLLDPACNIDFAPDDCEI
jgi:hypothetical protein